MILISQNIQYSPAQLQFPCRPHLGEMEVVTGPETDPGLPGLRHLFPPHRIIL